ncbi:hypothetical protein E4U30_002064 [Claviceps sp. LM220 group G6]|nr:hypothetical protein E4U30_002064 [Claviceps sp. LM220 group G6]
MLLRPGGLEPFWIVRSETEKTPAVCASSNAADSKKIPRPPNAYILYRKERHNAVKEANPGISNNEISQVLGKSWNLETRELRQRYKEMSENIKIAFHEKYPNYTYRPRKPSEKKRRAKRIKRAAPLDK